MFRQAGTLKGNFMQTAIYFPNKQEGNDTSMLWSVNVITCLL